MGNRNLIALAFAVFVGIIAVYLANAYFSGLQSRQQAVAEQAKLARIVVASQELAFGTPLSAQNVHLVNWPSSSVPAGAFSTIEEATRNRVALRPIVAGEPVLSSKVTGQDGRATISANLPMGKLAVSVAINDVSGVAGFIRPGDVVDVLLTRQIPGAGDEADAKMTDVLLQAVPVIGIDQVADEKKTDPASGKTATFEVDTIDAQKLALATQTGTLSLALRNVANQDRGDYRPVTVRDLSRGGYIFAPRRPAAKPAAPAASAIYAAALRSNASLAPPRPSGPAMTIIRGVTPTDYEVRRGY